MSVRRVGFSIAGDKREEVERRAGRNNALDLPERKDMMEVWIGPASAIVNLLCRYGSLVLQPP
jgi:hypothetical protein